MGNYCFLLTKREGGRSRNSDGSLQFEYLKPGGQIYCGLGKGHNTRIV